MKTGILGGTFNPVHTAHIQIAKACRDALSLDRLIIVPTFIPPHKSAEGLAAAEDRLAMCKLAIRDCLGFEVCDYELREMDKSYTYRTLRYVREKNPGSAFFLLMGGDMFLTVQDWRRPEEIYKMATLCVARRGTDGRDALAVHAEQLRREGAECILLDVDPPPISSTLIREKISMGEDVSDMLDPKILRYIKEKRLYGA